MFDNLEFKLNEDEKSYGVVGCDKKATEIIIPREYMGLPVTCLKNESFSFCRSLRKVHIPNGITQIDEGAFFWCESLEQINIPNSVTFFGGFLICKKLKNISLGSCEVSINGGDFLGCESLEYIIVDPNNSKYKSIDGNLYSKDGKTLIKYASGKKETTFEIPNHVTYIGESAFSDCKFLNNVIISNDVAAINEFAFAHSSIKSIVIGYGVSFIGENAFFNCGLLENIYVDSNNVSYQIINGSLYSKDGKTLVKYVSRTTNKSFEVPNLVNKIEPGAFFGCSSLESIVISEDIDVIESEMFGGCESLETIYIGNNIRQIEKRAFARCKSLKNIIVDPLNTTYMSIDGNLYSKDGSVLIKYASGKQTTDFKIPQGVIAINENAFEACNLLKSINIPEGVKFIGEKAFSACASLEKIYISDTVASMEEEAFSCCFSLGAIYCKSKEQPKGWHNNWLDVSDVCEAKVVWNSCICEFENHIKDESTQTENLLFEEYEEDEPEEIDIETDDLVLDLYDDLFEDFEEF